MKIKEGYSALFLALAIFLQAFLPALAAESTDLLQTQIDAKKQALEALEAEEKKYNEELAKTQSDKKNLSGEVSRIKQEISSLSFKIKVSQAQLDKLSLEMEKISSETKTTEEKIDLKRDVLAAALRGLYETEKTDNVLTVALTSSKISDTMLAIENLAGFGKSVEEELEELRMLKDDLAGQQEEAAKKKTQTENAERNLKNQQKTTLDLKEEKDYLLTQTKNQEKVYQSLLTDIEKKRAQVEAEISKLEESLQSQIDSSLLPKADSDALSWPANGTLTQGYGQTPDALYFYKKGIYTRPFHNGIDIGAPVGTPIYAAADGEVLAIGNQDKYCYKAAYGKFVVISHNNNLVTLYGHLSAISVNPGDFVKRGEVIGSMGHTGASTGSHLHFTAYFGPTFEMTTSAYCGPMPAGGPVNPLEYLE